MKKLLFYSWEANNEDIFINNLIKEGYHVIKYSFPCKHYTRDYDLAFDMIQYIHKNKIEGVISINYFPIISMVCETVGIMYYSWVYDSPHPTLFSKQTSNPCNRIGVFDNDLVHLLHSLDIDTAFHLPLAVDTKVFDHVLSADTKNSSKVQPCDISFVGSFYNDSNNEYDSLNVSDAVKQRTYSNIISYCFNYNMNTANLTVEDEQQWTNAMRESGILLSDDYIQVDSTLLHSSILDQKATCMERIELLSTICNLCNEYKIRIHTNSAFDSNSIISKYNYGIINYTSELPYVFHNSRINLNITLRSIKSGIPLRVLDIMACGGFVLSNRQSELQELFKENEELVLFDSKEDCIEKINYYLKHETERAAIAKKGKLAVINRFSYHDAISSLIK